MLVAERLKKGASEFEANLGYIQRSCLKNSKISDKAHGNLDSIPTTSKGKTDNVFGIKHLACAKVKSRVKFKGSSLEI